MARKSPAEAGRLDEAFLSISELAGLYRQRKLSPVEITRLMLSRIEKFNPSLNAYLTVCAERALAEAHQAEAELLGGRSKRRDRGALHGIPISLKDNIHSKGVCTTAGSRILRDFIPGRDARVAEKLREAGAILLGKTNMHEFAYGVTTNNPHYGPSRNPFDPERIPGGSSGGSAAALAAGLCYGTIGTDTGGSIRIPAALCGVVGLKPTFGSVSVEGTIPLSPTLDCAGPLGRSVSDAALLLAPVLERTPGPAGPKLRRQRSFRVGIIKELAEDAVDHQVLLAFERALRDFDDSGITSEEVSVPLWNATEDAGNQIAWAEATHGHQKAGWFPARSAEYSEDVRGRIERGTRVRAVDYLQALERRTQFIEQLHLLLETSRLDALAVPTTPIAAPLIGEEETWIAGKRHATRALLLRFNRPANLAGVPAISVPCGLDESGLPMSFQLIGAAGSEFRLVEIARKIEARQPALLRPPGYS
jgi:aspartyl-tRNA(Asn)/glutamyl-tRNA(Gln) amidotransferase subunit A